MNKLVWTTVILNSIEATGAISNGRALKMYSYAVHTKSFGGQKGGRANPFEPLLPAGLFRLTLHVTVVLYCSLGSH